MNGMKRLWMVAVSVGIAIGFVGIGLLGIGLMVAAVVFSPGIFWGILVFLMGLLATLAAAGWGMTAWQGVDGKTDSTTT